MNKGNVIEIRCKKCKKRFFDYLINDDKSSDMEVVMNGISLKCERCDRVMVASVYKGIHIKTTKNGLPTY